MKINTLCIKLSKMYWKIKITRKFDNNKTDPILDYLIGKKNMVKKELNDTEIYCTEKFNNYIK